MSLDRKFSLLAADWIKATMGSSYMDNITCVQEFSASFEGLVKSYNETIPVFKRLAEVKTDANIPFFL